MHTAKKKLRSNSSSADSLILFFWSFAFGQIIGNPLWGLFSLWSSSNVCVYFHFSVPDRERKVCEEDRSVGTKTRYMYLSRQVKLITSWLHRKHSWTFFYLYACLKSWIYVLCIGGNRYLYLGWGLSTLLHWLCGTLNPGHRLSETYPSSIQLFESVWPLKGLVTKKKYSNINVCQVMSCQPTKQIAALISHTVVIM